MMPSMRTILALLMLTGLAAAQNSDLALLAGVSGIRGQTTHIGASTGTLGTVTPSFQINYAWQVLRRAADLYIELPLVIAVRTSGETVSGPAFNGSVGNADPDIFFTPGVRLKISPESRVSFYGAAGFGIASFGATSFILPGPTFVSRNRENSAAFGFGGGIDFRLTRRLSLRADVRDRGCRWILCGQTHQHSGSDSIRSRVVSSSRSFPIVPFST
jgi:opacity protein-like surface antigen